MPWATVLSNLSFTPGAFSLAQQTYIESLLQDMYDTSPAAQGALDAAAGSKVLHITIAGTGLIAASDPGSNTIGINLSEVPQGRFFNSHGAQLVVRAWDFKSACCRCDRAKGDARRWVAPSIGARFYYARGWEPVFYFSGQGHPPSRCRNRSRLWSSFGTPVRFARA